MSVFTIQAGSRFVAGWRLRSGRKVAALHFDPDPRGYVLKGDSFGGWDPRLRDDSEAIAWAASRVLAAYPHAKPYLPEDERREAEEKREEAETHKAYCKAQRENDPFRRRDR